MSDSTMSDPIQKAAQPDPGNERPSGPKDSPDFQLAEYKALRDEILKRTELQHQLVSIALVALGALVSVGLKDSSTALLVYPLLAIFLSTMWSYHDLRIRQLGIYIRDRMESPLLGGEFGWEHYLASDAASRLVGARTILATRGILLGTEALTIGLYLLQKQNTGGPGAGWTLEDIVLVVLGVAAFVFTAVILRTQKATKSEISTTIQKAIS